MEPSEASGDCSMKSLTVASLLNDFMQCWECLGSAHITQWKRVDHPTRIPRIPTKFVKDSMAILEFEGIVIKSTEPLQTT